MERALGFDFRVASSTHTGRHTPFHPANRLLPTAIMGRVAETHLDMLEYRWVASTVHERMRTKTARRHGLYRDAPGHSEQPISQWLWMGMTAAAEQETS